MCCTAPSLFNTQMQKAKQTFKPQLILTQLLLLQPLNWGINMFEWRDTLVFVSVEGSVIRCPGSQEAGGSALPLCVCVCMDKGISVCVFVHHGEGHKLKQTKCSGLSSSNGSVLVIYTFSTCCWWTLGPVACRWDKQRAPSQHLIVH